jgi:hypothetical protein
VSEPIEDSGELDDNEKSDGQLFVTSGNSTVTFYSGEEVFGRVSMRIEAAVETIGSAPTAYGRDANRGFGARLSPTVLPTPSTTAASFVLRPPLIVHDRFHVAKHLNEAVDQTRRQETARLAEKGDESPKKNRYLWLHGTVPKQHQATFAELLEMNLKTSRDWLYKEQMVEFGSQADTGGGERFFKAVARPLI